MSAITKEMSFSEAIRTNPNAGEVFHKYGMGCVGCVAAVFETIEQGAHAHGIDVEALVKDLNTVS
jgi:hybrid cluster-associated redox disulfide protein